MLTMTDNVFTSKGDALIRICLTKQGRKTRALWGIILYHRMCVVTDELLHKPRSL